jgi:hypothetical protein
MTFEEIKKHAVQMAFDANNAGLKQALKYCKTKGDLLVTAKQASGVGAVAISDFINLFVSEAERGTSVKFSLLDFINEIAPVHCRTSCSDDDFFQNAHFNECGYPRCVRCALLFRAKNGEFPKGKTMIVKSLQVPE